MGNKKIFGKPVPFWGKLCAAAAAVTVMVSTAADNALWTTIASGNGGSEISQLEDMIKNIKMENDERKEKIKNLDSDIEKNKDSMNMISDQIDGVNNEIYMFGELIAAKIADIEKKKCEIEAVEASIADREDEIEDKKAEILALQAQNKENLAKFAQLARALYMNDLTDTIPVVNGSDDWYEYFVYSDVIRNISGQNVEFMNNLNNSIKQQENLIDELNDSIDKLDADKANLIKEKENCEKRKEELEKEKAELEEYAYEQQQYLYSLAAENDELMSKVEDLEYDIAKSNDKMEALNNQIEELIRAAQQGSSEVYSDGFRWPLHPDFQYISTYFGYDSWRNGQHRGIDIGNSGIGGANIYAAQSGTVISVVNYCTHNVGKWYSCGCGGGYGNYIVIDHGGGLSTLYAHCGSINVSNGDHVKKGDVIGHVGSTGWSTGFHLHFETRVNGTAVNPFGYEYQYVY